MPGRWGCPERRKTRTTTAGRHALRPPAAAAVPMAAAVSAVAFVAVPIAAVVAVPTVAVASGGGTAGAAAPGRLHPVRCAPLPHDPPVEAPGYARKAGASGGADGWWCQLPHATTLPAGLVAVDRSVAPLPGTYAVYATRYAHKGTTTGSRGPSITVSMDVASSVRPPAHLHYPNVPAAGRRLSLARGVDATASTSHGTTTVTWRYPRTGVPRYLRTVATVTVTGDGVPRATVVAVARHVRPD
ncbi:MAG TPA: hypothetical protein VHB02_07265 [Acidimicrobiales bacterium]|nr:hypothetical protein [Acidimicrobiales bacterium]